MAPQIGEQKAVSHIIEMFGVVCHGAAVILIRMQKNNPAVIKFFVDNPSGIEKITVFSGKHFPTEGKFPIFFSI